MEPSEVNELWHRVESIVAECDFGMFECEWEFRLHTGVSPVLLLRCYCELQCMATGESQKQAGRWHYISEHSIDSEIVQTLWLAVQLFIMHEARESFTFRGQPIFSPHLPLDKLALFVESNDPDVREVIQ